MEQDAARFFLSREVQKNIKTIQRDFFSVIDQLRAEDSDNVQAIKDILDDDELSERLRLFQENRSKEIRKRILDAVGNASREIEQTLNDYDIEFRGTNGKVEFKGIIKQ